MQLKVSSQKGEFWDIEADPTTTVGEFREMMAESVETDPKNVIVKLNGVVLTDDSATFESLNVEAFGNIDLEYKVEFCYCLKC